jgi:hypothetical protein
MHYPYRPQANYFAISRVWMTPFQLAGAKYTDAQEAWDILKDFL